MVDFIFNDNMAAGEGLTSLVYNLHMRVVLMSAHPDATNIIMHSQFRFFPNII